VGGGQTSLSGGVGGGVLPLRGESAISAVIREKKSLKTFWEGGKRDVTGGFLTKRE